MATTWSACPKCGSANVYTSDGPGVGFDVHLRVSTDGELIPSEEWNTYLCTDCGYFENYVTGRDMLDKIQHDPAGQGWQRGGG